jgi:hypothetical protein
MKNFIYFLIISAVILTQFTGCKKDKGDPPVLPPAESMKIDFSNFESGEKGGNTINQAKNIQNTNWKFAATAALACRALLYLPLSVPVYSFQQTISKKPVNIGDKTWQWSADATLLNITYNSRLIGQITGSNIIWKMYITKTGSGGYNDFLWVEGTSESDGSEGQWVLYESQQNPVKIVEIDWIISDDDVRSVRFTYTKSGVLANSFIEYGLTSSSLDAYYKISYYNPLYEQIFDLDVEWSSSLNNGRVKCQKFFGIPDWNCWDSNYLNVNCPQE